MEAMRQQPGGMGDPPQLSLQPKPPEKLPAEVDIHLQEGANIFYFAEPTSPPLVIFARDREVQIVDIEHPETNNWTYSSSLAPITIGRANTNDIQLLKLPVSGHHAEITKKGSQWTIKDRRSTNGTYREVNPIVNGIDLEGTVPFGGWTVLDIANNELTVTISGKQMMLLNTGMDNWSLYDQTTNTERPIPDRQFTDVQGNQFLLIGDKLLIHDTGNHAPSAELTYQQSPRQHPHDNYRFTKFPPEIRRFSSAPGDRYKITGVAANSDEHPEKGEDWSDADAKKGILVIADGAGGHAHGEIAAHMAVNTIKNDLLNFLEDNPRPTQDQLRVFFETTFGNAKTAMVTRANENKATNSNSKLDQMTTTVSAAVVTFDYVGVATTGDTRLYATVKTVDGRTETVLLTRDHNTVYAQLQAGNITEETAREIDRRLDNTLNVDDLENPPLYDVQGRKINVEGEYWRKKNLIAKNISALSQDASVYTPEAFFYPRRGRIVGADGNALNGEIISITGATDGIEGIARKELDPFLKGEKPLSALVHDAQMQDDYRSKSYDDDKYVVQMNVPSLPIRTGQ